MQFRGPSEQLGGVCWLPRLIDKVRAFLGEKLPEDYQAGFCSPGGMDGVFLSFFDLQQDQFIAAVRESAGNDEQMAKWFQAQPGVSSVTIDNWNREAPRIGAPGQRGYERFSKLVRERYADAPYTGVESVFEVIEADEGRNN